MLVAKRSVNSLWFEKESLLTGYSVILNSSGKKCSEQCMVQK